MTERISRREFTGSISSSIAGAVAVTVAGTNAVLAGGVPTAGAAQKESSPPENPNPATSTLDLITQIAVQEYPSKNLDAAAIEEIRADVRSNLFRSKVLSSFPLVNSDEPGFIFSAWRKDLV